MSFNRPLTGQSQIYATVALNTNVCSNSVSTTYLSATYASFTNMTTNTWTAGNVSTPNVIATNGYISNLYISTINSSNLVLPSATIINLSTSNISNSSTITTSTITAYTANTSFVNSCLVNVSTTYSNYAYVSNISVSEISIATQIDIDGDCIAVNGRFQHAQIQNAGGNTQFVIEQVGNYTNQNIVNSGVQSIEFTRLNASLASLNSSRCIFWNPVYTSTTYSSVVNSLTSNTSTLNSSSLNTSNMSVSNLSTSNISVTAVSVIGQINASRIRASTDIISVGNLSGVDIYGSGVNCSNVFVSQQVNTSTVSCRSITNVSTNSSWLNASNSSIGNLSVTTETVTTHNSTTINSSTGNFSTLNASNLNPTSIVVTNFSGTNVSVQSLNIYNGNSCIGTIAKFGSSLRLNTSNTQVSGFDIVLGSNLKFSQGINDATFYTSLNASRANFSILNVSTFSPANIMTTTVTASTLTASSLNISNFNPTTITTSTMNVSKIYTLNSISSASTVAIRSDGVTIRDINSSGTAYLGLNYDSSSFGGEIYGLVLEADQTDGAVISAGYECPLTITLDGVSQLYNTCAGGFQFYNTIHSSFAANISTINVSNISGTNGSFTNLTITNGTAPPIRILDTGVIEAPMLNVSMDSTIQYLTATNGTCEMEWIIQDQLTFRTGTGPGTLEGDVGRNSSYITFRNFQPLCHGYSFANNTGVEYASFNGSDLKFCATNASLSNISNWNLSGYNISSENISVNNEITSTYVTAYSIYSDQLSTGGSFTATNLVAKGGNITLMDSTYNNYKTTNFNTSTVIDTYNAGYGDNYRIDMGGNTVMNMNVCNVSFYGTSVYTSTIFNTSQYTSYINACNASIDTLTNTSGTIIRINNTSLFTSNISVSSISTSTLTNVSATLTRINNTSFFGTNMSVASISCSNISVTGKINVSTITIFNSSTTNGSVNALSTSNLNATNISTTSISGNASWISLNCSQLNTCAKINASYVSAIGISVDNISATNELTIPFVTCSGTVQSDGVTVGAYLGVNGPADFNSSTNISYLYISQINNSFRAINTTLPITITSVSNDANTGIRLPNFIDSQDTGTGITIGSNHTAGFINCCRGTRVYGNLLTTGNINPITATNNLVIGNTLTTGHLQLGSTTMTGNVSIDTTGYVNFSCDRRSTYNSSNLVGYSTQLGSYYFTNTVQIVNRTTAGASYVFSPNATTNPTMTTLPVGLYMISVNGCLESYASYTGTISYQMGVALGTTLPMTNANTTRVVLSQDNGAMNFTSASGSAFLPISVSGVVSITTTGQYLAGYGLISLAGTITAGNVDYRIRSVFITKIA